MSTFYISFDTATGEIKKVTNRLDDEYPVIEIDKETHADFIIGRKSAFDYLVLPSGEDDKTYKLTEKHKDLLDFDVDKSVHNIKKVDTIDLDNGIIIKQNLKKGTWVLSVTPKLKAFLVTTTYYKDKTHYFYVTHQDDPNILLDSLEMPMWKILYNDEAEIENVDLKVAQTPNVSVYCGKVFNNYVHIQESE